MAQITVKIKDNQKDAYSVRLAVFVAEQKFQNEFDDIDNICEYVTLYDENKPIATGRYFPDPKDREDTFVFGRIAVLKPYRGCHIGMALIGSLETAAKLKGGKKAILLAEGHAVGFYEKCGFVRSHKVQNFFTDNYDHPIYEGGVQLVDMVYLQRRL